jgi:TldD protein
MRAQLSADLLPIRETLTQLLPDLEIDPEGYASIFFERKATQNLTANLKSTQVSDQVSMGVVLRIYDGYTLFEEATDDLEPASLREFAAAFASRVKSTPKAQGAPKRPYRPLTWKDRLSQGKHEDELFNQLPKELKASTPVHFGIRYTKEPKGLPVSKTLETLKGVVDRFKTLASDCGMKADELTYVVARHGYSLEESIFIDRETNMSQALYRLAVTVVAMSGADRTFERLGGLGGLEITEISDDLIRELLHKLKALKGAERLHPGKYRVLFGPGTSGVLAHEAFGHSQEADTCARGRSKAWEIHKTGQKVGNEHATILNNPAIYDNADTGYAAWGSYFFDEEGWLAREQVLLDRGKLQAPMTNLTSAVRLGIPRSANGKRESWANGVYTRQTNTYFSAGDKTFDELVEQMGDGFIALHPAGGMEDPKGMGIQVGIAYLEEVKGGRLTGRVFKGPVGGDIQMTGYTPDILDSILGKSKIEAKSTSPDQARYPLNDAGGCGKYHKEFVFAGCGGPYMLLDNVMLG